MVPANQSATLKNFKWNRPRYWWLFCSLLSCPKDILLLWVWVIQYDWKNQWNRNILKLTRSFHALKISKNYIKFDFKSSLFLLQIQIKSAWKKSKILFFYSFPGNNFSSFEIIKVWTNIVFFDPFLSWIYSKADMFYRAYNFEGKCNYDQFEIKWSKREKCRNDSEASNDKRPLFKIMNRKRYLHM